MPDGIDHHARAVRSFGAIAGLVPMTAFGCGAIIALWGSQSPLRGAIGFVLAVMACPTLPVLGFPVTTGSGSWAAVIATSAMVWMALGHLAGRRATSRPVAGWPEWRREWLRLAIGVWVGSLIGFAIAGVLLTVEL